MAQWAVMTEIRIDRLRRTYGSLVAVRDISFVFADGKVTCLLGPSGCGKTTLMRMIAGLERPTAGAVRFGDRDVTHLSPRRRDVAMVFQYPVMYRTLSVVENIELPLANDRTIALAERRRRVDEVIEVLQLGDCRTLHIDRLDLGSRQKVAVGRAIARHCAVTLFDEPTTNVEVHAKLALIRAFKELRRRIRQTIIYVTHDQTEAMTLADQIALMREGEIIQCAAPRELYDEPNSEFGGWFLGNPGMNFLPPRGERGGGLVFDVFASPIAKPVGEAAGILLGIRPEYVRVVPPRAPGAVRARVLRRSVTIGGQLLLTLAVGETRLKAKVAPDAACFVDEEVAIECPLQHAVFFRGGLRLPDAARAFSARVHA
jgi:ABC-type sugar transport system ATPase subunit